MAVSRFMLPLLLLAFLSSSFTTLTKSAENPDAVVGTWLNGTKKGHIQIYKQGSKYFGKLVFLTEPNDPATGKPKVDSKNPDAKLRSRALLNLNLMNDFVFDGDSQWEDGKIYNPEDGKTYSCYMKLNNPNTLTVRGYVGIKMLGKSQTWTRIK
ncbi:DUF2147 domain-containing protein [Fibrella sp. HMF5335]|uniref:DUF2147 domain-containing protein n=1 Tax=Fibrella rubiginis TaxID=2817060 RepID=A0A939GKL4_9BACT|nr:DUF2147 domain-containing protein [Fibrella rubiginis]MBO0939583.1 DUF2147 domain-containing protein [Fibrella rubiginis]